MTNDSLQGPEDPERGNPTQHEARGIKVTDKERFLATQLFGDAQKFNDENHIQRHNLFMQILAEKYGYAWQLHEMNPETGEIVKK